jgi:outer membrane protein assembly factor BamB
MKSKTVLHTSLLLLTASLATAQVPCGPTINPLPTLFVNWPQFRFDPAHTGCNPYEYLLSSSTVGSLAERWHYSSGPPYLAVISGEPTVANGEVYFASNDNETNDYGVYALDANTGVLAWKHQFSDLIGASPIVANGIAYVGTMYSPYAVLALNARTGAVIWQAPAPGPVQSPLATSNGRIYVVSLDGTLQALDAGTGAVLWSYYAGPNLPSGNAAPAIANNKVYFAAGDTNFYALDATTGTVIWKSQLGNLESPTVASNKVYVGSFTDSVYALNGDNGAIVWTAPVEPFGCCEAVARGVVYVGSYDYNVYALNANTGAVLWKYATDNYVYFVSVANGVVYAATYDAIYALDANTGAPLWSDRPAFAVSAPLTVANGWLYVTSLDSVLGYDLQ